MKILKDGLIQTECRFKTRRVEGCIQEAKYCPAATIGASCSWDYKELVMYWTSYIKYMNMEDPISGDR